MPLYFYIFSYFQFSVNASKFIRPFNCVHFFFSCVPEASVILKESTKEFDPRGLNFQRVGLCVSEQVYFSPLERFFVLFSDTDLPKITVLAFVRDEFHCIFPPHLARKEEAEGWSGQALSPQPTHLLSGPVCT